MNHYTCKFCGSTDIISDTSVPDGKFYLECNECNIKGPECNTEKEATDAFLKLMEISENPCLNLLKEFQENTLKVNQLKEQTKIIEERNKKILSELCDRFEITGFMTHLKVRYVEKDLTEALIKTFLSTETK